MTEYRIVECTKGLHSWYEIEVWEPVWSWFGTGKFEWQSVKRASNIFRGRIEPYRFLSKKEAMLFADDRFAPLERKIVK